jgi:2-amino-4-hydroxy-6-hydroxymethyldihydropteridine diphosphokinase
VGLGANLGDREATLRRAAELLDASRLSTIRETDPWGPVEQPRYLNAVAEIATELTPRALLERLLSVEAQLGRTRDDGVRWGPRTIDLDLLVLGDLVVDEPGLELPHPRLHERLFVLEPLAELAPELELPGRGPVAQILAKLQLEA